MKFIKKVSKALHKYFGLLIILFIGWMSISGVLLNHPELISGISVPGWLIPSEYHYTNWNRSALRNIVESEQDSSLIFASGKSGVWKSNDNGKTFSSMNHSGFPESAFNKKTSSLFLIEKEKNRYLFACSKSGLFLFDEKNNYWEKISLPENSGKPVKIIENENLLYLITDSGILYSSKDPEEIKFIQIELKRSSENEEVSLITLFFNLHDGHIWGLPGVLLFDFAGIVFFFLSVSAFYIWYFPSRFKPLKLTKKIFSGKISTMKLMWKYHLKLGIWLAVILILITVTGFFMRPPALMAIVNGSISTKYYPGFLPENKWEGKIRNAGFNNETTTLTLDCTDGIWTGSLEDFQFDKIKLPVTPFPMGATVLRYEKDNLIMGSFSGLFKISEKETINILTGKSPSGKRSFRPSRFMITGYENLKDTSVIFSHRQGLTSIKGNVFQDRFKMPDELKNNFKMSLWNVLFEIHNGRYFRFVLGSFYILLVPLGSLLTFIVLVTGILDWFFARKKKE